MITALEKVSFARMLGGGLRAGARAAAPAARPGMQMGGGAAAAQATAARSQFARPAALHPTVAAAQMPKTVAPGASAIGNTGRRPVSPMGGRMAGLLTPRNVIGAGALGAGAAGLYAANRFGKGMQQQNSPFQQRNQELEDIYSRGGKL